MISCIHRPTLMSGAMLRILILAVIGLILAACDPPTPTPTPTPGPSPIVMLDPGHGGTDPGASGNGLMEKDVNRDIALRVKGILANRGCDVRMTRTDDITVDLNSRWQQANQEDALIFVSIHANSSTSSTVKGTGGIYANEYNREIESIRLMNSIYNRMSSFGTWQSPYPNGPNSCHDENGHTFPCGVLTYTHMPAVIVETLFISNPEDAAVLRDRQDEIAQRMADGILDYLFSLGALSIPPQGTGSGGSGGMESLPAWWDWNTTPRSLPSATPTPDAQWRWASEILAAADSQVSLAARQATSYTIALADLMPVNVLTGTTRVLGQPADVIGHSNALEAISADYLIPISGSNVITAAVVAFRTIDGVYSHDYAICGRFKDGYLSYVTPITATSTITTTPPLYFWGSLLRKTGYIAENATSFAVYVSPDEETFTVDAQWLGDQYPTSDTGYVLTFQVWAVDPRATAMLAVDILQNLDSRGSMIYRNNEPLPVPKAYLSKARYAHDQAELMVVNLGEITRTVVLTAVTWTAPYPESGRTDYFTRSVAPGTSDVQLPLPARLDGIIYADDGAGFVDKVYVADGNWFVFSDAESGGTSHVQSIPLQCESATNLGPGDRVLAGCGEIIGTVGVHGWAGMGRGLATPNRPLVNVSRYQALTFFARGDGNSYRVSVESEAVRQAGSSDYHQFVFTPSSNWRQFVIPLTAFRQRNWNPGASIPFTGNDVVAVTWSTASEPLDSFGIAVDKVAFVNSTIISGTTVLSNTTDVNGPYPVSTYITDDISTPIADLFYSIDGGQSFTSQPMVAQGQVYRAAIPGQPLDTEARYFVRTTDGAGNVATDPVDVPYTTYRFQVSNHPYLLVDDFNDGNPTNVLGGNSGTFAADFGGWAQKRYQGGLLQLDYDVRDPNTYAGYYTLLQHGDLVGYSAITFMIRGNAGGEKIKLGLRDDTHHETKIIINEYLARGITNAWQKVTIPLAAFASVIDWSSMDNFNIDFEYGIGSGSGTVYLDNIKFETISNLPIVVDNYDNMSGENGVGGHLWAYGGGGAGIVTAYDTANPYGGYGAAYQVTYVDVAPEAWATAVTELADLNASTARTLSFYIKGAHGAERPNIYLASQNGATTVRKYVDIENYGTVTTSWQRMDIPLADFADQGVDLSGLASLEVVFEWEAMTGTVYLDKVQIGSIPGDLDWDCDVDVSDIAQVVERWNDSTGNASYVSTFDLDLDGDVDIADIILVTRQWGTACGT